MALKSAWAFNNGKRTMKEALTIADKIDQENKEMAKGKFREKVESQRDAKQEKNEKMWEVLRVGDSLAVYGLPNIVISKKNKMSILDKFGKKWTKTEIFNLS